MYGGASGPTWQSGDFRPVISAIGFQIPLKLTVASDPLARPLRPTGDRLCRA